MINFVPLQAFVKMVGANVNVMEEHLTQAEGELGTIPSAFKKIFRTMSVPGFLNVTAPHILKRKSERRATSGNVVCVCVLTSRNQPAREDQRRISVSRFQACSGQTTTSHRSRNSNTHGQ